MYQKWYACQFEAQLCQSKNKKWYDWAGNLWLEPKWWLLWGIVHTGMVSSSLKLAGCHCEEATLWLGEWSYKRDRLNNGWPTIKTIDITNVCVNTEGRCLPLNLVPGQFPRGTGVGLRRQRRFRLHCLCGRQRGGIRIWQPLWVASPPPIAISLLFGKCNFFGAGAVAPS